jgi:hypothetical protein
VKFMMIVKHAENQGMPPKELMDAIGKLSDEAVKARRNTGRAGKVSRRSVRCLGRTTSRVSHNGAG